MSTWWDPTRKQSVNQLVHPRGTVDTYLRIVIAAAALGEVGAVAVVHGQHRAGGAGLQGQKRRTGLTLCDGAHA